MNILFFVIAILSAVWGVISSIFITDYLSKHGVKINYLLIRVMILKYIHQYSKMTTEENGKSGLWYYSFVISMNLTLISAIIGIVLR